MKYLLTVLMLISTSTFCFSQTTGIIVRPAGVAGPAVLDLNGNGFTSSTTSGFGSNDVTNSEIPYKVVMPIFPEPIGDLIRGPSGLFSDIVRTVDGSGFYLFNDGTNLLCRLRIDGIVSGSKGYSILMDTDMRFGASGTQADPNYMPATNGNNGNPGFEIELVLETNFRIAVYNVDGTSSPVLLFSYPLTTNSQVSIAGTTNSSTRDYFYDFYVPMTALGITATTPFRVVATTVMAPLPAIGGPKSDIYGMSGNNYMNDWTDIITNQPPIVLNDLLSGGSGPGPLCTAPPVLTGPIAPTTASVSGTWTKSSFSSISTAVITLYKGSTTLGTTSVTSGNTWTIAVSGLLNNDIISAKAQATGESQCLSSNTVTVNGCTSSSHTATPAVTCSSTRGFEGTRASGASIKLYKVRATGYVLYADDASTAYLITYPTATTWRYDDVNTQSGSACTGGPADIASGAYALTAELSPNCASLPLNFCISGTAAPTTPALTSSLIQGLSSITGTTSANAGVILWIDNYYIQSVVANASGVFSFTLTNPLEANQTISIAAATNGSCESSIFSGTVSCFITAPVINADVTGKVTIGTALDGTSSAATGTMITIYNGSTNAVIGTTTVAANGTWTMASPLVTAATTYYAKCTGTTCGNSLASNTVTAATGTSSARCGTITAPIFETATTISGTVTGSVASTIVTVYIDGISIGSTTIAGTVWSITVNTTVFNTIYANGVITIGITEPGKTEVFCAASATVSCIAPGVPVLSPSVITINTGETVTYTITTSEAGILYSIRNDTDDANMGESKFGTGGTITLVSDVFNTPGTYNLLLKSTSFTGGDCKATGSATVNVASILPVSLVDFTGQHLDKMNRLNWTCLSEQNISVYDVQRSYSNIEFETIGSVSAHNAPVSNYEFFDRNISSKGLFYRLSIKEMDGSFRLSNIVYLKSDASSDVQVMPNPFTDHIEIRTELNEEGKGEIKITDIYGRKIFSRNQYLVSGTNQITLANLGYLSQGIYYLQISLNGTVKNVPLLKK